MLRFGSLCSGIEAASQAWNPLGWSAQFFSEIDPFAASVLHHHHSSGRPKFMPSPDDEGLDEKDRKERRAAIKAVSHLPTAANGVPNYGDMTTFEEWNDHAIDLLVGGTPCQDFSVAGLRAGLDGVRGSLMLTYAAVARRYRPRWVVWENVPGVLSDDGGRGFASLLGLLSGRRIEVPAKGWRNAGIIPGYKGAYGLAWRVLDAQFVRVDGFPFAVPQRRRRVFVVGYLGDWRRAAAVLLEPESMRGDNPPRREKTKDFADSIGGRASRGSGGRGTGLTAVDVAPTMRAGKNITGGDRPPGTDIDTVDTLIMSSGQANAEIREDGGAPTLTLLHEAPIVAHALTANPNDKRAADRETYVSVAHTLRGEGFDASEDGSGRGTPIVPVAAPLMSGMAKSGTRLPDQQGALIPLDTTQLTNPNNRSNPQDGDPCHPLSATAHPPAVAIEAPLAFPTEMSSTQVASSENLSPALSVKHTTSVAYALRADAARSGEALNESPDAEGKMRKRDAGFNFCEEFTPTLDSSAPHTVAKQWAVRRLTPTECARLQGFPDDHCRIPWRGKEAEDCPDGPQYARYGNSMAVNVMQWLGQRIQMVEEMTNGESK